MSFSLYKFVTTLGMAALLAGGGYVGYRWARADVAASIYRDRLEAVARDYETLRTRYNDAVRKAAVTELVVNDGKVTLEVRLPDPTGQTPGGVLTRLDTPVDPAREIFVDYAIVGGRLLIRRVFDSATPADKAMIIDPALASVDWDSPQASHGTAVYRRLTEGRWIVSVTGNGALGLSRSEIGEPVPLVGSPDVKSYDQELAQADAKLGQIGWGDLWRKVTGK